MTQQFYWWSRQNFLVQRLYAVTYFVVYITWWTDLNACHTYVWGRQTAVVANQKQFLRITMLMCKKIAPISNANTRMDIRLQTCKSNYANVEIVQTRVKQVRNTHRRNVLHNVSKFTSYFAGNRLCTQRVWRVNCQFNGHRSPIPFQKRRQQCPWQDYGVGGVVEMFRCAIEMKSCQHNFK